MTAPQPAPQPEPRHEGVRRVLARLPWFGTYSHVGIVLEESVRWSA